MPSLTTQCRSYWEDSIKLTFDYGHQLYVYICKNTIFLSFFLYIYMYRYTHTWKFSLSLYIYMCVCVWVYSNLTIVAHSSLIKHLHEQTNILRYLWKKIWLKVIKCYTLSSFQINNGLFLFDNEDRENSTSQREKANKYKKEGKRRDKRKQ